MPGLPDPHPGPTDSETPGGRARNLFYALLVIRMCNCFREIRFCRMTIIGISADSLRLHRGKTEVFSPSFCSDRQLFL